jgi:hypothetical protein
MSFSDPDGCDVERIVCLVLVYPLKQLQGSDDGQFLYASLRGRTSEIMKRETDGMRKLFYGRSSMENEDCMLSVGFLLRAHHFGPVHPAGEKSNQVSFEEHAPAYPPWRSCELLLTSGVSLAGES